MGTSFPSVRVIRGLVLLLALSASSGCRGKKNEDDSSAHLKAGLLALDRGDEGAAERELSKSLAARPKNAEARIALASIHARRAGFPLNVWLDPLIAAGKQVDSKMRSYGSVGDVHRSLEDEDPDHGLGPTGYPLMNRDPKSRELEELRGRIRAIYENLGKLATGTMVAIDLFESLPYLEEPQLASLDRAIQVLREDDADPDNRQEKVKVYLAALALMKFIHHLRAFVGSFDHEAKKMFTHSSRFCTIDAPEARTRVVEIHDALMLVEEGLRIREEDATNGQLRARRQLHSFVRTRLLGPVWNEVEKFFERGSEQNYMVMRYVSRLCGAGKRPGSGPNPQPIPGGPPGANLWDPDAEDD